MLGMMVRENKWKGLHVLWTWFFHFFGYQNQDRSKSKKIKSSHCKFKGKTETKWHCTNVLHFPSFRIYSLQPQSLELYVCNLSSEMISRLAFHKSVIAIIYFFYFLRWGWWGYYFKQKQTSREVQVLARVQKWRELSFLSSNSNMQVIYKQISVF